MDFDKIRFCEKHISDLEKRLDEIYTIKVPSEIESETYKGHINARKELEKLKYVESIYSIVERDGIPLGEVYEKYMGYLKNARERIQVLQKEISRIEKENEIEIKNIEVLLEKFNLELKKARNEASV